MKKLLLLICLVFGLCFSSVSTDYTWNYQTVAETEQVDHSIIADHIMSVQRYDEDRATDLARIVYEESVNSSLEYSFVLAIIMTESRFNENARSYCGAMGLMQIMPKTFDAVAKKNGFPFRRDEAYEPRKNVKVGIAYLESLYARFGNLDLVAAGYNGGPGAAMKYIKLKKGEDVRVPAQTLAYVKKVRKYHGIFKEMLDEQTN